MRGWVVITLTTVVLALAVACAWGQAEGAGETDATLARLEMTYESELAKLEAESVTEDVSLQDQYLKSLEALQTQLQRNGQLEPILAVHMERERFEKEKDVSPGALSAVHDLLRVQNAYLAARVELDVAHSRRILDLAGKYDRSLGSLQTRVTREGKLDAAVLIKTQRDELTDRPEISSARFAVAEAEAEREQTVAEPEPPAVTETASEGDGGSHIVKRFRGFCDALAKDDMESARRYVDPEYVNRKGTDVVNGVLGLLAGPYVKIVRVFHGKLDSGTIMVAEDGQTASHRPRFWAEGRWKEVRPMYWVQRDSEWYIDMEGRPGPPARKLEDGRGRTGKPGVNVKGDGIPPRRALRDRS